MELFDELEISDMKALWNAMDKADETIGCEQYPDAFFPENSMPGNSSESMWAKSMCQSCPVKRQCAEYAIKYNIAEGIWGGTMPRERQTIRRLRSMS